MKKNFGGKLAREGKADLWKYTNENDGSFTSPDADFMSRLFFPLFNRNGMMSSVTPDLKGDILSDFNHYLTIPSVTEDFHRSINNRNVWITCENDSPWSAAGNSAEQKSKKWISDEDSIVKASPGIFTTERTNKKHALKISITNFVPAEEEFVELMKIRISNEGDTNKSLSLCTATPIYGRSADNVRDHRNVTTMFINNFVEEHGVRIQPRINFNEHGHSDNNTSYVVLGFDGNGEKPVDIWSTVKEFIGEGGSLDNPEALVNPDMIRPLKKSEIEGYESIGALRFKEITLKAGTSVTYIVIHGITEKTDKISFWKEKYGSEKKINTSLENTKNYWDKLINRVELKTPDPDFNNWVRWVNYQLFCRQVYGNSFLPDFGYGRGGRGWRDLYSDLLSIFLIDPESAGAEIINNFKGVRVDGTNATIVGTKPGEFKADRNDVPRVWSDHGSWPFFVLNFYMQQTGDTDVLFRECTYWKDKFIYRSKKHDTEWDESYGFLQKTNKNEIYKATILEHTLIQNLSSFFHVGKNNNILLEGADWNDTYDMARNNGESVCFYNWYGGNLKEIIKLLSYLKKEKSLKEISFLKEASILFDTLSENNVDYRNPAEKKQFLMDYYEKVKHNVSGEKVIIPIADIIADLEKKVEHIFHHIRTNEWLTTKDGESFFNGHYDDNSNRVHGDHPRGVRMDLTSQVLPTIFGTATDEQIKKMYSSIRKYLHDPSTGGIRLCSEIKEDKLYFGRLTGFIFGHKEHGGKWMQQNAMLIYGLYKRGFVEEAFEVLTDVFNLCNKSSVSKIFPGIPSYFENDGRGSYHYLTGSATWLMFGLVTEMYGVRGVYGDLRIDPKLKSEQFDKNGETGIKLNFRGFDLDILFRNPGKKDWRDYAIGEILINGKKIESGNSKGIIVDFESLQNNCNKNDNRIEVNLV